MKSILSLVMAVLISFNLFAQDDLSNLFANEKKTSDPVTATFKTSRLNMSHSIETVGAHQLDFRISHNFSEIGSGTSHNMYGFNQISNIRIALEYGINKNLTFGLGSSKGFGTVKELYDGYLKYKLLHQTTDNKMPVSVTLLGVSTICGAKASSDPTSDTHYSAFAERISYCSQILIARKFSEKLSIQIMPTYVHRNFVANNGDENDFFAMGFAGRYKFTKRSAIVIDYYKPFSAYRNTLHKAGQYYNPLGIGYEIETGGHVFHISLVNTGGLVETDFIPNSNTSWTKNFGVRMGFNISRWFHIY
ncbi:MAG: hypothetical protein RJA07_1270 [Bacteroidota bacterium]|jgi:hypothetical protein